MFQLIAKALADEATATDAVAEVAEATPSWFQTAFKKFASFPLWAWILVAVLLVGGFIAYRAIKGSKKTVWSTKMISMGAICMALSCVLSLIRLWSMPQGGSVTPASMMPMMLFAYVYGVGPGLALGAVYGVLQYILGPWFVSVPQVLLDYPIAFAMTALAGLFRHMKDERVGLSLGVIVACIGRFVAAVASGVIFFAEYAEGSGMSPMVYSISYNGSYMLWECIICVVLSVLVGGRLVRELKKNA